MRSRSHSAVCAAPILTLAILMTGCGESKPGAPLPPPPSTVPILTAPTTTSAPVAATNFEVKPDPVKYPQDTPEKAMESLAKALEADDLAYQIAWLATPDYTQRMTEKYKTIAAAVEANQSPEKAAGRKALLETIRKMQAAKTTTQGEEHGVKWFCYKLGEDQLIQLERQHGGRWCWNPKIRAAKQ